MQRILWPDDSVLKNFKALSYNEKLNYLVDKLGYDREMLDDLDDDYLVDIFENDYRNDDAAPLIKYAEIMHNQCVSDVFYLDSNPPEKIDDLEAFLIENNGALKLNDNNEVVVDCHLGNNIKVIGIQDLDALTKIEEASSIEEENKLAIELGKPIIIQLNENLMEAEEPDNLSDELVKIKRLYDNFGVEYFTAMPLYNFDNDTSSIEYQFPKFFKIILTFLKEQALSDLSDRTVTENVWYNLTDTDFKTVLKVSENVLLDNKTTSKLVQTESKVLKESFDGNQSLRDLLHSKVDEEELSEDVGPEYINYNTFSERDEERLYALCELRGPQEALDRLIAYLPDATVSMWLSKMDSIFHLDDYYAKLDADYEKKTKLPEDDSDMMIKEQLQQDLNNEKLKRIKFYRYNAGLKDDEPLPEQFDNFAIKRTCARYNIDEDTLKEELLGETK